jgi:hypothetical protein
MAGNDIVEAGEGGPGDDTLAGFGGADRFVFRADMPGEDTINDSDTAADAVELVGFATDFDPLANLSASAAGAVLDLAKAATGRTLWPSAAGSIRPAPLAVAGVPAPSCGWQLPEREPHRGDPP